MTARERRRHRHAAPHGRGRARPARAAARSPSRELWDAYRAAIDARDGELHAFLTLADEPDGDGVPIALKDVISTKGVRTTAGSKILENYVPVFDATVAARCRAAAHARARQDEHRRVRDGLLDRELRVRPDAQPVGPEPRAGRLGRRLGGRGLGRVSRRGRSAPTPAARSSCRPRSAATSACGRPTARSRATASSRSRRASTRSARSRRNVRDNALLYRIISGRDEHDSTTVDVPPVVLPEGDDLKGVRIGVPRQLNEVEGIEPGVKAAVEAAIEHAERARRGARRRASCRSRSTTACPATT